MEMMSRLGFLVAIRIPRINSIAILNLFRFSVLHFFILFLSALVFRISKVSMN